MTREDIVESITQLVLDHEDLQEWAGRVGEDGAMIDRVDLVEIEDTAPYNLYWALYSEEQARIIGMVQQKLFSYHK